VSLEVGGANARNGGACVEVGLTEGYRSSFEQYNPRVPSTLEKDTAKMVDGMLGTMTIEPVTKEK
jgi:hypothetical protein